MLAVLPLGFRIGGGFYNIGPKISYNGTGPMGSYPIPFSVRLGFAWKHEVVVSGIRLFCPVSTIEMNREITRNNAGRQPDNFIRAIYDDLISDTLENRRDELQKFILHRGAELNIMNTVSVRVGGLIGAAEDRYEIHEGLGVNVLNHIAMDYVRIFSTNNRPRNGQWSINVNLFNLVKWSKNDFCWWRKV